MILKYQQEVRELFFPSLSTMPADFSREYRVRYGDFHLMSGAGVSRLGIKGTLAVSVEAPRVAGQILGEWPVAGPGAQFSLIPSVTKLGK